MFPGRLCYGLCFLGFLALAVYGSLVPFAYRPLPTDEALRRWREIPYLTLGVHSRADFVANILLFVPLGFTLLGSLALDRRAWVGLAAAPFAATLLFGLSLAVEFAQIYFPPRTVSVNDIVAETAGAVLGVALWLACGQRVTDWARGLWRGWGGGNLAGRLLPAYLLVLVVIHVMPLDLTIRPAELYAKYKQGRVILVPFTTPHDGWFDFAAKLFWNSVYFLPLGVLLARLPGPTARGAGPALLAGAAVAAAVEGMQLFVFTRYFDATDVVTGTVAVLAGWLAARRTLPAPAARDTGGRTWARAAGTGLLLLAWAGVLAAFFWQPFNFTADPAVVKDRLARVNVVPFVDLYWGTEYHAFDQILQKTLLFLPVGAVLALGLRARPSAAGVAGACVLGFGIAAGIEAAQVLLPGHYPSATDVLIGTCAAGAGFWLAAALGAASSSQRYPTRGAL